MPVPYGNQSPATAVRSHRNTSSHGRRRHRQAPVPVGNRHRPESLILLPIFHLFSACFPHVPAAKPSSPVIIVSHEPGKAEIIPTKPSCKVRINLCAEPFESLRRMTSFSCCKAGKCLAQLHFDPGCTLIVLPGLMAKGLRCEERSNGRDWPVPILVRASQLRDDREHKRLSRQIG